MPPTGVERVCSYAFSLFLIDNESILRFRLSIAFSYSVLFLLLGKRRRLSGSHVLYFLLMGVSYGHRAILIFTDSDDGQAFASELPERMPAANWIGTVPCEKRIELEGELVILDTQGYGLIDLDQLDYPSSLDKAISAVESRQGQEVDYVELIYGDVLLDGLHNVGPEGKEKWDARNLLWHFTTLEGWGEQVEEAWSAIEDHAIGSVWRGLIEMHLLQNSNADDELAQRISDRSYMQ